MQIRTEDFTYQHGGRTFAGYLAWNADLHEQRPGIAIVHEWFGPGDNVKRRARMLAELGYVGFAVDMYGVDVRPTNPGEAAAAMNDVQADREELRARLKAAIQVLQHDDRVDALQVAAIGYCFGGGCVLELARSGAELAGVVSFHGALHTSLPAQAKPNAKILVLHGADDPFVDPPKIATFMAEMRAVHADWQMVYYGGAVHSFTNPQAHDLQAGFCFDAKSDARSWMHMRTFFIELFA